MNEDGGHVIEINPKGKYLLIFPYPISQQMADQLHADVAEWIKSDDPFLIIAGAGNVRLVKTECPEEAPKEGVS